jgi:hypothetical protein
MNSESDEILVDCNISATHTTPKKFLKYLDGIKDEGALIYQYTDRENQHSSLLFKMKKPHGGYTYYNYDCVQRFNYGFLNSNMFVYYKDDDTTVDQIKRDLVIFLTRTCGFLLFRFAPEPKILIAPEDYFDVTYSKFQKFAGGTIRNIILVILLIVILVVIVIVIHNKFFKPNHNAEINNAKNI